MKKIIIVNGLIAGAIVTGFMIYGTISMGKNPNYDLGMVLGYAGMLAAFSFIFVGIKQFRDKQNGGFISFGKAFKIGLYISLIASSIYVGVWLIEYYFFMPDFMDKYSEHMMEVAKTKNYTAEELQKTVDEMAFYKKMYQNPIFIILMTYVEILPLALVVALISAGILRKKEKIAVQ